MEHAVHAGGDPNTQLAHLLVGRDTRWWRGHLGKLNLVIVSTRLSQVSPTPHLRSCLTEERVLARDLPLARSRLLRSSSSSPP
jgi:hypothetical protein